jgi:hypothetical protein
MVEQPVLTPAEWELIAELLNFERRDLPAEIHHTMTGSVRDELRDRRNLVDQLRKKIDAYLAAASQATTST